LSAGSHTIAVTTTGLCEASTGSFTVNGPAGPAVSSTTRSECTSYLWNGTTYTASGVYTFNTTSGAGCDSTATLNLTIKNTTSSSSSASVCPSSLPYQWNGGSYTASGVYTFNSTNAAGCDSTATLNLTVKSNTSNSVSATVCAAALPYSWNGGSYTASGVYTFNTTNAAGCDSTVTLNLTVAQSGSSQTPVSVCASTLPYSWNGSNYTSAGTYTFNTTTVNGCDSVATLVLTVNASSTSTTIASACVSAGAYSWNGGSYTASGTYSFTTTNAAGCDSVAILNLSVTSTTPSVSPAITQVLVSNLCGARTYRYSAAVTANATGYNWILPTSVGGVSGVTLDSGFATSSRVIVVTYASNAAALSTDSIKVRAYSGCGFTAYKAAKLSNTALVVPAAPATISITPLITNVCGNRVYRYSVPSLPAGSATAGAATGYVWEFVGSLSEFATIDSGDVNSQRIVVSYTSNAAALTGDSIKFYYTSGCGNSLTRAAKLTNTALKEPVAAAATGVKITPIQTNVCGARRYRYSAPNLPAATATTGAATGYVWDFVGSLQSTMTVDSGDLNSQVFTVTFTSNAAAGLDSVRMYYTSDCGNSLRRAVKLSNTLLSAPAAAAATGVTITPIQTNVCSSRKYRYSAPNLPLATATTGAASGYVWDFVGSLQGTMTIDSGDVNSQRFTVTFTSNAAAGLDSVRMFYTSAGCGNSARRAVKLSNTLLSAPAAATAVTITPIQTNVCAARKYRYSAPNLPLATASTGAASGYVWDFVGSLQGTMTIDSGDVNSQRFTVTFTSNAAAGLDSVRVLYTTAGCGNSARKAAKLSNTLLTAPLAPTAITIQQVLPDVCFARKYRYIAPAVLPGATTTAGAASGYLWSAPTGPVGSTGTIDSGEVTSRIITVTYTSNAAAGVDSIRLRYTTNGCGNGAIKAQKLSNLVRNGCVPPITKNTSTSRVPATLSTSMEVKVYPNPTTSQFNVQVKSSGTEEAVVRVLDVTGRFIKSVKVSSNSNVNLGSDLKAGAYMLEVRQGKEVKTVRVMKF
jgi:aryl carrier-like protein